MPDAGPALEPPEPPGRLRPKALNFGAPRIIAEWRSAPQGACNIAAQRDPVKTRFQVPWVPQNGAPNRPRTRPRVIHRPNDTETDAPAPTSPRFPQSQGPRAGQSMTSNRPFSGRPLSSGRFVPPPLQQQHLVRRKWRLSSILRPMVYDSRASRGSASSEGRGPHRVWPPTPAASRLAFAELRTPHPLCSPLGRTSSQHPGHTVTSEPRHQPPSSRSTAPPFHVEPLTTPLEPHTTPPHRVPRDGSLHATTH